MYTLSIKLLIMSLLCATPMHTHTGSVKLYGAARLADQTYTDLEIYGSAHLKRITVANNASVFGSAHLTDFKSPRLTVKGSLTCTDIVVADADIFGAFNGTNGQFDQLTIHGSCIAHATKISKKLTVFGSLVATNMQCPLIEVHAKRIEFKNATVGAITVKESRDTYTGIFNLWGLFNWGTNTPHTTELYVDESKVDTITFQGAPGRVILSNQSSVGTVINGTIENQ